MLNDIEKQIEQLHSLDSEISYLDKNFRIITTKLIEDSNNKLSYSFIECLHLKHINNYIANQFDREEIIKQLIILIEKSNYNVGRMIKQRANRYKNKNLFLKTNEQNINQISYQKAWNDIKTIGLAISYIELDSQETIIGIFSKNSYKSAILDLACLSFGFTVVPIPYNSTTEDLVSIINDSKISHLFIRENININIKDIIKANHNIKKIINLEEIKYISDILLDWEDFISLSLKNKNDDLDDRINSTQMNKLSTIMYTSGSTDEPKGVIFTQKNLITKRLSRAIALPDICNNDIFLCYLPLFHTFGRFFELIGSIYWGATYVFAESPSFNNLLKDFKLVKPTVFISIPKRWVQLFDKLDNKLNLDKDSQGAINDDLRDITGGRLKFGLSAAGYLDPDIFRFFQRCGIELLSGYGMTEATGGITMTPPNQYQENSVGKILPGLELKLNHDGELLMRGPYISPGFHGKESRSFNDGWFYSGDIFEIKNNHYYIIDRKKDIYKNSRGQTIAPQKIENLFNDFESVKSVFLVGDGKEFNTVLIYPSKDLSNINKNEIEKVKIHFNSILISVNTFLPAFERIINFCIINRNFSIEFDELTVKGTFKRKNVLNNFSRLIAPMYKKNYITLTHKSKSIEIPNWFLREKGVIKNNIFWDGYQLSIDSNNESIIFIWEDNIITFGNYKYKISNNTFKLKLLINAPNLWLGNQEIIKFTNEIVFRIKESIPITGLEIIKDYSDYNNQSNVDFLSKKANSQLEKIHFSLIAYLSNDKNFNTILNDLVKSAKLEWKTEIINTYLQYFDHPISSFRLMLLESLTPLLSGNLFINLLESAYYYQREQKPEKGLTFKIQSMKESHFNSILQKLKYLYNKLSDLKNNEIHFLQTLLLIISDYAIIHPTKYIPARAEMIFWKIRKTDNSISSTAQKGYYNLVNGFRNWIGPNMPVTIDRETGKEYTWHDVITFDDNILKNHERKLKRVIENNSIVRESIFLFSNNNLVQLTDISKKGIWISHLSSKNGKSIFRVLVKTNTLGSYNFIINLNEELDKSFIEEEIYLLILMGVNPRGKKLVENFGGYWIEENIYTEEYIPGETLNNYLERHKKEIVENIAIDRWQMRWLHFIWNGVQAYVEFWKRTDFKYKISPPSINNLIIPQYDYASITRLISISDRKEFESVSDFFLELYTYYILKTESQFKGLKHMADWELIFMVTIQTLKPEIAISKITKLKKNLNDNNFGPKFKELELTKSRINNFLYDYNISGTLTKPVVFASLRYERWLDLNPRATNQAKASILKGLYLDYNLNSIIEDYPETRVRFFMMTCFKDSNQKLIKNLQRIINGLIKNNISQNQIESEIKSISSRIELSDNEKYFLPRMLFPHINSADYAQLVSTRVGNDEKLNLVYKAECADGHLYNIRPPFIPKEIAKFQSLLDSQNLSTTFTMEHEFLLIFNERNNLVGGLYWKNKKDNSIHLEWVIIRESYRNIRLGKILISEFYNRVRQKNKEVITVGFYLESFFYKQGFSMNKEYGGLMKLLEN